MAKHWIVGFGLVLFACDAGEDESCPNGTCLQVEVGGDLDILDAGDGPPPDVAFDESFGEDLRDMSDGPDPDGAWLDVAPPDVALDSAVVDGQIRDATADLPDGSDPDDSVIDVPIPDFAIPDVLPDVGCVPAEEECDGRDDDCDGLVDEGYAGLGEACSTGEGACFAEGTTVCIDLDTVGCGAVAGEPSAERCGDEIDDDCDGAVDEGFEMLGMACVVGMGACASEGQIECNDGSARCSAIAGQPTDETCSGIDDDCDGAVDEMWEGLGEDCVVGVGVCAVEGASVCTPPQVVCDAVPLDAGTELCDDALDNDCDGALDEGFDRLGQACSAGVTECARDGNFVCTGNRLDTVCNAVPADPVAELCDRLDNDCDTRTDEAFDLTSDPVNCRDCGRACEQYPNTREAACSASACVVGRCVAGWQDFDGLVPNGCECNPANEDLPDSNFLDVNCDGIDGDASAAVFLSARSGRANGGGGINDPVSQLARALTLAGNRGHDVYVDAGNYTLPSTQVVPDGVSIYGGYLYTPGQGWARASRAMNQAVFAGPAVALVYRNLSEETVLDSVEVQAADAAPMESSVGIMAVDVGEFLVLKASRISSGSASPSSSGNDGQIQPGQGRNGIGGLPGDAMFSPGAGGGLVQNPDCGANSGAGGNGANAFGDGRPAVAGNRGDDGGDAGTAGLMSRDGGEGGRGNDGPAGFSTPAGRTGGAMAPVTGLWTPASSFDGLGGRAGTGGGGGGGGGAAAGGIGGGGASGGSGGCPGQAGTGAPGGGGSFALQVDGGSVRVVGCEFSPGRGGNGGAGGAGSVGRQGGIGGMGGAGTGGAGNGGRGGDGGNGGCGGSAGGGAGGPSVCVFLVDGAGVRYQNEAGQAVAAAGCTLGAAGAGGPGGQRAGCPNGADDGADGLVAEVACCTVAGGGICDPLEGCAP